MHQMIIRKEINHQIDIYSLYCWSGQMCADAIWQSIICCYEYELVVRKYD
jgi:hypothetical protein